MPNSCDITFGGERLVLRADRTLYWPRRKILLVADLHAGKAEHMRSYGLAVPAGSLTADLKRLQVALIETGADRLIFLGDLFHSEPNTEWSEFAEWCRCQAASMELVKGNHDRFLTADMFAMADLTVHDEPYDGLAPFSLRHHPPEKNENEAAVIAGHIHPVTWIQGRAKDRLRLACFWQQPNRLILPAFGSLTGGHTVRLMGNELCYACAPDFSMIIKTS